MPADVIYLVTEVYPSHVVLDGNHPLAGMALRLHIKVRDVREATDAEIEARSVGERTARVSVLDAGGAPRRGCTDTIALSERPQPPRFSRARSSRSRPRRAALASKLSTRGTPPAPPAR
jgi:hypothetical protein